MVLASTASAVTIWTVLYHGTVTNNSTGIGISVQPMPSKIYYNQLFWCHPFFSQLQFNNCIRICSSISLVISLKCLPNMPCTDIQYVRAAVQFGISLADLWVLIPMPIYKYLNGTKSATSVSNTCRAMCAELVFPAHLHVDWLRLAMHKSI